MALQSFNHILATLSQESPNKIAIICGDESITYQALDRQSNRLARAYQQQGVKAQDLVTFGLPNGIEFFTVCFALWKLGATPQPVSYRLPKKELEAIVSLTKSPVVIGIDQAVLPKHRVIAAGYQPEATISDAPLEEATANHWKAPTSGGSTGRPKIIVPGKPACIDPREDSLVRAPIQSSVLVPGPLYHNAPFDAAMGGLLRGNQVVVMPKFDAEQALKLIEQHQIEWTMMVPTMMQRIWRLPDEVRKQYTLTSLKTLWHAAAPCAEWLKREWINWLGGDVICELYGGTEGHGNTWITGTEWLQHPGSVGKIQAGCQIKIVNDEGEALAAGQAGEIYFLPETGQGSTYHYIGAEPDQIEGGWETLGDMGYLDEDGYLYLCDRKKDLIISGGANIYPAEVEGAIESHPNVRSAIVVGLPDEDLGQKVHALVDAPKGITQTALCEFLLTELVRYKIPRTFEFVDRPLRDDAGKARRSALVLEGLTI